MAKAKSNKKDPKAPKNSLEASPKESAGTNHPREVSRTPGESPGRSGEEILNLDAAAFKPTDHKFMIAGLGASAGGIQAFQHFFQQVPANSGIAYVAILHLSPDHDSRLAEVLQTATKMPVTQVNEKTKVKPDHVYVVPP